MKQFYALKWNANLRAPGEGQSNLWRKMKHAVPGILRLGEREQEAIPQCRDDVQGCFAIDYIPLVSASKDHQLLLNRVFLDRQDERIQANVKASWLHMMAAVVAEEAKAALDLATERMGSETEFYPSSPVFIENHDISETKYDISGSHVVDLTSPGPDASFGARKLGRLSSTRKLFSAVRGDASDHELVYKTAKNPEHAISGAATPEVDNVTEFTEGFREEDASDVTVPPYPNNMELKE